jgi:FAD/FMN-containing dehydrogenase
MLIHPQDDAFEEARQVFNGMIDRRPALIARCTSDEDVVHAVQSARDRGLPLSVYGGGHAVTGSAMCEAGVCVDMRGMRGIAVDPVARARCGLRAGSTGANSTRRRRRTA